MSPRKLKKEVSKNKKLIEKVTSILQKRGEKALETAKNIILSEKLECKEINEAFEYYVKNWGDYIHPALVSIACEAVNGNPDDSIPIQAVMLLFTAAFDIHDDIIDESKTKYGKPTLLGKFGKDIALLVGDAFLIKALTHLHRLETQISTQKINRIWDVIDKQFFELGDAEALEASLKGNVDIPPEECFRIVEKKASSFEVHMRIGAVIGGGKQEEIDILGNYGRTLGILNTVRDDFIDIFEPEELQNRMKNELLPFPMLYAFKNPQAKEAILEVLSKPKISNRNAERIVDIIFRERNVQIFKERIQCLVEKTIKSISGLQNQDVKSQMQTLITGLLEDL